MKAILSILLMILAVPTFAHAGDWFAPLSKTDIALMAADTALLTVDWGQTRYFATHPGGFHEINPLLGRHPSESTVNDQFAAAIPAYWLSVWMLPPREDHGYKRWFNRRTFEVLVTAGESANVGRNFSIRAGLRF